MKGKVKGSIIFSWTILFIISFPQKKNSHFTYDQRHILTGLLFVLQINNAMKVMKFYLLVLEMWKESRDFGI